MNNNDDATKPTDDISLFMSTIMIAMKAVVVDTKQKRCQSDTPVVQLWTDKDVIVMANSSDITTAGTQHYYQLVRNHCNDDTDDAVKTVMEGVEGSFLIQEESDYYVMDVAQVKQMVEATLEAAKQVVLMNNNNNNRKRLLSDVQKNENNDVRTKKQATVFSPTSQDVLGDDSRNPLNPGNLLFRQLVSQHLKDFGPDAKSNVYCQSIITAIEAQGGRFLTANNQGILSDAQSKAKVWVALNHEQQQQQQSTADIHNINTVSAVTAAAAYNHAAADDITNDDDDTGPRKSDVLGGLGRLKNNPGNVLFRDLVSLHVEEYGQPGMASTVISRVLEQILNQPGRFLSSNNQTVLSKSQSRNKVRLALHNKLMKIRSSLTTTTTSHTTNATTSHSTMGAQEQHREPDEVAAGTPQPMDVYERSDGSITPNNPGNVLFRQLVSMNVANFSSTSTANNQSVIDSIVKAIHSAGGRFLSLDHHYILNSNKTNAKVWVALQEEEKQHNTATDPSSVVVSGSDEDGAATAADAAEFMESVQTWCEV